jgi:hypothetical protein
MSIDVSFCRALLAQIIPDVKASGKRVVKDAWVWCAGRDHWEFHGPDGFFWHGNASNAYDARYKGWSAWLENPKGRH